MSANFVLVGTSPPFAFIILPPRDRAYLMGRAAECDIIVKNDTVSRRHAEILSIDSSVHVADLQSSNGTFIEQVRIDQGTLMIGQNLRLGNVSFILATSDEAQLLDSDLETARGASNEQRTASFPRADFAARWLSPAQQRVFQFLLAGHPEKIIAKCLSISQHTVHNHIRAIYAAFGVHSRSQLLAAVLQNGQALKPQPQGVEKTVNSRKLESGG